MRQRGLRGRRTPKKAAVSVMVLGIVAWLVPLVNERSSPSPSNSRHHAPEPSASGIALSSAPAGGELSGKVIRVLDGDTLEILQESEGEKRPIRVRLAGIDAPEKAQPFGEYCRKALAEQVAARTVRVEPRGVDRYSRQIGVIFLDSSQSSVDVNLHQIEVGCAWHYKQYQRQQRPDEKVRYGESEMRARDQKLGLWRDPDRTPPWEFRRARLRKGRRR